MNYSLATFENNSDEQRDSLNLLNSSSFSIRPELRRKILLLGGASVGKTAYLMRVKQNSFIDYYEPTIYSIVKSAMKLNQDLIDIEFIDIEGLSEYSVLSQKNFAFGINGYILAYSTTDKKSFDLIRSINSKLINITNQNIPRLLIGTKCDLSERRQVSYNEGVRLSKIINCPFYECSSKSGYHIEKCLKVILAEINKYDNGFDINSVGCLKLTKFIMRRHYLRTTYYIVSIISMLCCVFFFGFSFRFIENCSEERLLIFGLFFYGCWEIIFSVFGMIGLSSQRVEYIYYNLIATVLAVIFDVGLMIYQKLNNQKCKPTFEDEMKILNYILYGIVVLNLVCLGIVIFFGYFFYRIFKLELYSYII